MAPYPRQETWTKEIPLKRGRTIIVLALVEPSISKGNGVTYEIIQQILCYSNKAPSDDLWQWQTRQDTYMIGLELDRFEPNVSKILVALTSSASYAFTIVRYYTEIVKKVNILMIPVK